MKGLDGLNCVNSGGQLKNGQKKRKKSAVVGCGKRRTHANHAVRIDDI